MYRPACDTLEIAYTAILMMAGLSFMQPALANLVGVNISTGELYSISETTAQTTMIGNTHISGATGQWGDIQFYNGTLYGFTVSLPPANPAPPPPTLYSINPSTAAVSPIGTLSPLGGSSVFEGALTVAPNGTAYGMNLGSQGADQLFTINLANGAVTSLGVVKNSTGTANANLDINGLAYSNGELIGLDDLSNSLVVIDPTTLRETTSVSVMSTCGTVGAVGGMTVENGVGYYATAGTGASPTGSDKLCSFNLSTLASTSIGSLGFTDMGLSGLAAVPVPKPSAPATFGILIAALAILELAHRRHRTRSVLQRSIDNLA